MKTVTEKLEKTEKAILDVNDNSKLVSQLTDVLSVLSKNDALTIFQMTEGGIKSEIDTPARIGLTKKQYYTRLKQLVDLGLITKRNESYIQTAFGKVVYQKHIVGLTNNIKNSKYLQMVDVLKADPKFNDKDIMEFMSKVEPQISSDMQDTSKPSTITWSWEEMISKVLETMEFAEKEIILVSRFTNELIINTMIKKANSGVFVRVLSDTNLIRGFFEKAGPIKNNDKNHKERVNVVSNPYYPTPMQRKYVDVPFCILIVDKKNVGIEVVDAYNSNKFKMAVFSTDRQFANQLQDFVDTLWSKAKEDPPQLVTKSS
jgi:predicted transcriptional regulator